MTKRKIWYKKRTTRGHGRKVQGRPRLNAKNLKTEVYKNQGIYSHFFLKFILFALLGMIWFEFGTPIAFGGTKFAALPLGLAIGLILISFERFRIGRGIELAILLIAGLASYFLPVGILL
jgi:hypothetical protein